MTKSGISMENGQAFEAAINAMPSLSILKTLVYEASVFAQARAARYPPIMGYAGDKKNSSSSGNIATPGKTFWKRHDGAYKVAKDKIKKTTRHRSVGEITKMRHYTYTVKEVLGIIPVGKFRSEQLSNKMRWPMHKAGDGMIVEVVTDVRYAAYVKGGKDDEQPQALIMKKRGWENMDDVAAAVEDNIGKIMRATVARLYQQWFKRYGIDSQVN